MGHRPLESLQRVVADSIRRGVDPDGDRTARTEPLLMASKRGQSSRSRLDIYREQFRLRHVSNLTDDFPTLAWVIGTRGFEDLLGGYLEAFPPRTWDLQKLGADLPRYVAAHAPWKSDRLAVDASLLDWAFMEAFDASDAAPLDLRALADATEDAWMAARIELHPSVRKVAVAHPVHDLRDAVRQNEARERPAAADARVVVWRDAACLLHATAIERAAFDLLVLLSEGTPLGKACEAATNTGEPSELANPGASVGEWFREWTANGWVSAVRLDS